MLFLHAGVHRQHYREMMGALPHLGNEPPEPVTIPCPACGDLYLADLEPWEEPPDLEADEWEATTVLAAECPDHRHSFELD